MPQSIGDQAVTVVFAAARKLLNSASKGLTKEVLQQTIYDIDKAIWEFKLVIDRNNGQIDTLLRHINTAKITLQKLDTQINQLLDEDREDLAKRVQADYNNKQKALTALEHQLQKERDEGTQFDEFLEGLEAKREEFMLQSSQVIQDHSEAEASEHAAGAIQRANAAFDGPDFTQLQNGYAQRAATARATLKRVVGSYQNSNKEIEQFLKNSEVDDALAARKAARMQRSAQQ